MNNDLWRRKQWKRYEVLRYLDKERDKLESMRDQAEDHIDEQIDTDLLIECKRLGYTLVQGAKAGDGRHILRIQKGGRTVGVECPGKDKCIVCRDGIMRHEEYRDPEYKEEEFESMVPECFDEIESDADRRKTIWRYYRGMAEKNKKKRKRIDREDEEVEFHLYDILKDRASGSTDMQSGTDPVPVQPKEPGPDPPTSPVQSQQ